MITLRFFLVDKSEAARDINTEAIPRVGELVVVDGNEDARLVMGVMHRPAAGLVDVFVSNPEAKA